MTSKLYNLAKSTNKRVFNLMNKDLYIVEVEGDLFYIDKQSLTPWPPKYFIKWIEKVTGLTYLYHAIAEAEGRRF